MADDFFQPISLTDSQLAQLRHEVARVLDKALAERDRGRFGIDCAAWRLHTEHEGLRHFKRPHKKRANASVSRVVGTVQGDYLDLTRSFKSETRAQCFNVEKKLSKDTVDAAILYNVPRQPGSDCATSPIAHEGVKWVAYEPFALRFRTDSCHFESIGTGVDANDAPYAYRVILPTVFDQVPDLFKSKRTVRMESKSVLIFSPSDRSDTSSEIFMTMQNDFKSNRVPRSMYRRFLVSLHQLHSLPETEFVWNKNQWMHETPHQACSVCAKPFYLLRSKHHCVVCSDTVCRRCMVRDSDSHHSSVKVCLPCVKMTREERNGARDTPVLGDDARSTRHATPPYYLRLSETSTEASRLIGTYLSATSRSSGSSSLNWTTTPTGKLAPGRARVGTDRTDRTDSSSVASLIGDSNVARCDSPVFAMIDATYDQAPNMEADEVIFEEDSDLSSRRSASDYIIIDTSDMARVRTVSGNFVYPIGMSPAVFENISSSIQEQEMLLKELIERATGGPSVHRNTRGPSCG